MGVASISALRLQRIEARALRCNNPPTCATPRIHCKLRRARTGEKGCTPAQLVIAWVLAQGEDVITIPGSKRLKHLEEYIASERVHLSKEDLKSIEAIMPAGIVSGTRYPERFLSALNRQAMVDRIVGMIFDYPV